MLNKELIFQSDWKKFPPNSPSQYNEKQNWIGHVVRNEELLKKVLERWMEGRNLGRSKMGINNCLPYGGDTEMDRKEKTKWNWRFWCRGPANRHGTNDDTDNINRASQDI